MVESPPEPARGAGESSSDRRSRRFPGPPLRLLLLVPFGLLLAALILELGLQATARFFGFRAVPAPSSDGHETILALGDSHTYGVFYAPEEAYPGQLEMLLEQREPGRYRVVNLGLPGMNSSEVASRLERWYLQYRPSIAVVCVGMNNVWNETDTSRDESVILSNLRLVRFVRLLVLASRLGGARTDRPTLDRRLMEEGAAGVEHRDAATGELLIRHSGNIHERLPLEQARATLRRDLESMRRTSEAAGVELVLLTYPALSVPLAAAMSDELKAFSLKRGIHLVEARDRFRELLSDPDTARREYFHTEKDSHPNARGYAEIAALVAERISLLGVPVSSPPH